MNCLKIDRKRIDTLISMSDSRMWGAIKFFASANGVDLSKKRVTPGDLSNLRRMLSSLTDADLIRAGELADVFKYGR